MTVQQLGSGNDNVIIDGGNKQVQDFGGNDTYTITTAPISQDVEITDNQASKIILPVGLNITSSKFAANGLILGVGGKNITFLGAPQNFTYVLAGNPLVPGSGVSKTFSELAAILGTTVPASGVNNGTKAGPVNPDGTVGDTTPPSLTTTVPADNATNVAVGSNIVLTFNEPVTAGVGNITINDVLGPDDRVIPVTDATQVIFSGNTVTINPTNDLANDTQYEVLIPSGVIKDASGNPFAGIVSTALDFKTEPAPFSLTVDKTQVTEGQILTVTAKVTPAASADTNVTFQLNPGDPTAPNAGTNKSNLNDFAAGSFNPVNAVIKAGQTSVTFTVNPLLDGITELPEEFSVKATLGSITKTVTATILDGAQQDATFTLTNGADIITPSTNSTGQPPGVFPGNGNNTFVANQLTLNSSDSLDGGGNGADLDRVDFSSDTTIPINLAGFKLKDIERFEAEVDNIAAPFALTFDFSSSTGIKTVVSDGSSSNVEFNQLTSLVGLELINLTKVGVTAPDTTVRFQDSVVGGASDTIDITINNSSSGKIQIGKVGDAPGTFTGIETINLKSINGPSLIDDIVSSFKTLNITGDKDVKITNLLEGVTTIDASTFTGGLSVIVDSGAFGVKVIGGAGNDRADFSLGLGADDQFDGGGGTNTLAVGSLGIIGAPNVSNVQTLAVTAPQATITYDASKIASVTTYSLEKGLVASANLTIDKMDNNETLELKNQGGVNVGTIDLNLKSNTSSDAVKFSVVDLSASTTVNKLDVTGFESLTINATKTAAANLVINQLEGPDLQSLTITGNAGVVINNSNTSNLTKVDGSNSSGSLDLTKLQLKASGATVIGGSGNDFLPSGAGKDTLTGGPGADRFIYDLNTDSQGLNPDTITDFQSTIDVIDLEGVLIQSGLGAVVFKGNGANFGATQSLITAGSGNLQVAFQQDTQTLYVDFNDDGTLNQNDLQILLPGVTELKAQDVSGVTAVTGQNLKSTAAAFNTLTGVNIQGGTKVTTADDTLEIPAVGHLAGSTLDGKQGTDTIKLTQVGGNYDFTSVASVTSFEVVQLTGAGTSLKIKDTLDQGFKTIKGDASANNNAITFDGSATSIDLTNLALEEINVINFGSTAATTLKAQAADLAKVNKIVTNGGNDTLSLLDTINIDFTTIDAITGAPLSLELAGTSANYTIKLDDPDNIKTIKNEANKVLSGTITIDATGETSATPLLFDFTNGSVIPTGVVTVDHKAFNATAQTLKVFSGTGNDVVNVTNTAAIAPAALKLELGGGNDTLNLKLKNSVITGAGTLVSVETINVTEDTVSGPLNITFVFGSGDRTAATTINITDPLFTDGANDPNVTISDTSNGAALTINLNAIFAATYSINTSGALSTDVVNVKLINNNGLDVTLDTVKLGGETDDTLNINLNGKNLGGTLNTTNITGITNFVVTDSAGGGKIGDTTTLKFTNTNGITKFDSSAVSTNTKIDISGYLTSVLTVNLGDGNDTLVGGIKGGLNSPTLINFGRGNATIDDIIGTDLTGTTFKVLNPTGGGSQTITFAATTKDLGSGVVFDFEDPVLSISPTLGAGQSIAKQVIITQLGGTDTSILLDVNGDNALSPGETQFVITGQLLNVASFSINGAGNLVIN